MPVGILRLDERRGRTCVLRIKRHWKSGPKEGWGTPWVCMSPTGFGRGYSLKEKMELLLLPSYPITCRVDWLSCTWRSGEVVGFAPLAPGPLQGSFRYCPHSDLILCVFSQVSLIHSHHNLVYRGNVLSLHTNIKRKSGKYPRRTTHPRRKTASTGARYHAAGRSPDVQLEKLFRCGQVIAVIRRRNMDKSLVGLQVQGDVPHLRTSGLDCREATVADQQRNHILEDNRASLNKTPYPSLSAQIGFTYFHEVDRFCNDSLALEPEGHLQNDDGTQIAKADRVPIALHAPYCRVQLGVAVDGRVRRSSLTLCPVNTACGWRVKRLTMLSFPLCHPSLRLHRPHSRSLLTPRYRSGCTRLLWCERCSWSWNLSTRTKCLLHACLTQIL